MATPGQFSQAAFGECHEPGTAFLAGHHVLDGRAVQPVKDIEEALAGNGVHTLDACPFELANNQVAGGGCAQCFIPSSSMERAGRNSPESAVSTETTSRMMAPGQKELLAATRAVAISGTKPEMTPAVLEVMATPV